MVFADFGAKFSSFSASETKAPCVADSADRAADERVYRDAALMGRIISPSFLAASVDSILALAEIFPGTMFRPLPGGASEYIK